MDPWCLLEEMAAPIAAFKKELESQPQTLLALGKDGVTSESGRRQWQHLVKATGLPPQKRFFLIGVSNSLSFVFFLPSNSAFQRQVFSLVVLKILLHNLKIKNFSELLFMCIIASSELVDV